MSQSQDLNPEEPHPAEDLCLDEELGEIQRQLCDDADRLHALFPVRDAKRLEAFVSASLTPSVSKQEGVDRTGVSRSPVPSGSRRSGKWTRVALTACLGAGLVGAMMWVVKPAAKDSPDEPVASQQAPEAGVKATPASITSLPTEFLNASQPELEALYDLMPKGNVSVEY